MYDISRYRPFIPLFFWVITCGPSLRAVAIYADSNSSDSVIKIDLSGGSPLVSTFVTGIPGPRGTAFDSSGNLYVASAVNNTITEVTPQGTTSILVSTGLAFPEGIAFDS